MLLISETHDAATPFRGSLEARRLFPNSSLIEGVGGTTHAASLSGVACTDNAIAAYLSTGVVPARRPGRRADKNCPPVPQPHPKANPSRALVDGPGLAREGFGPELLRRTLSAARRP